MADLVLPITHFPLPQGDSLEHMIRESERIVEAHGAVPWMVLGGTARERLAVGRPGLGPGQAAAVELALLVETDAQWTALCGEAALPSGMGLLRHVFVRRRFADERWEVATRPFLHQEELIWLGEWSRQSGVGPVGGALAPIFPEPDEVEVRFLPDIDEVIPPAAVVDVPDGSTVDDVIRMAGHLMESFFVANGFVPPSAVRWIGERLEVRVLPRTSPAHASSDLAIRLCQDNDTKAIGIYSRNKDTRIQPPAEQVRMRLEFRDGPAVAWRRRFRIVGQNRARWLDAAGEVVPVEGDRLWLQGP